MKKFVKIFAYIIIFTLCGAFVLRCILVADTSVFSKPVMTEQMMAAYTEDKADDFVLTVDVAPEMSESGYFRAYGFYYIPSVGQAQFTVRWNDSAYTYTDMAQGTEFAFEIRNVTTGESYPAVAVESKERAMYNFRRMTAEGVSFGKEDDVIVVMHLRDGYTDKQFLHAANQPVKEYKLTEKDKVTLAGEK